MNTESPPFSFLKNMHPSALGTLLNRESAKVAAVVLAHMDRVFSAQVLADFPPHFQREVVQEMRTAKTTPPAVLKEIAEALKEKGHPAKPAVPGQVGSDGGNITSRAEKVSYGGPEVAAAILRFASPETRRLIKQSDPALWSSLQTRMYTFDDLLHTPHRSLQLIFQEVEVKTMALALKAVVPSLKKRIYENISPRRTALVEEELGRLERLSMSDIEAAQQDIINRALELQRSGHVILDEREAI